MSRRVAVIGSGAAGAAAAHAATRRGAVVTVIDRGPGATALGSGAVDGVPDDASAVAPFLADLGLWEMARDEARVATTAGALRAVCGRDRAVLDLANVPPGPVAVIDGGRPGWDAAALARAWSSEPWALSRRLAFVPVPLDLFRTKDELYFEDVELALLHDEPSRADWLIDRLRENQRLEGANAIVMGPWLGVGSDVAVRLARAVGRPIGEALSAPGGPAGARFERARDALFARLGTPRHAGRVTALRADGLRGAEVVLASGEVVVADAVVVATGGLVGGGLAWSRAGFVLSFACSGALAQRHAVLDRGASGPGTPFAPLAWVVGSRAGFERVGLWIDELARLRGPDGRPLHALYAAGDAVADAPRTLGAAIGSGVRAGLAAAAG